MKAYEIDDLVADLKPVRPLAPREGIAMVSAAACASSLLVAVLFGLRPDIVALRPDEMVVLRSGVLLLLGFAALFSVTRSARPSIGQRNDGWRWALAAAALFPVASALLAMRGGGFPEQVLTEKTVVWCLVISLSSASLIGGVLVRWLRRGAVLNLERAGWLVGLSAGALGTFAYNLHCPSTTVHFIGVWYSLAVLASAVAGRLVVPRHIRW